MTDARKRGQHMSYVEAGPLRPHCDLVWLFDYGCIFAILFVFVGEGVAPIVCLAIFGDVRAVPTYEWCVLISIPNASQYSRRGFIGELSRSGELHVRGAWANVGRVRGWFFCVGAPAKKRQRPMDASWGACMIWSWDRWPVAQTWHNVEI